MRKVGDILSLVTPKNAEPPASCHHVLLSWSFIVSAYERNCACNYEQAELLAYKQEKFTVSFLWLSVCLAVHSHSHVSACPLSDSETFFFPYSHFTGLQLAERRCAARLFSCVVFMSLLVRGFTNLSHGGGCLRIQPSLGVCVSLCVRERETKQDMWP